MNNKVTFWVGVVWASPFTAIAMVLALFCYAFGARALIARSNESRYQCAVVFHGNACRVVLRILVPWLKADGITIGHIVFVITDDKSLPAEWLLAHELVHTQQWSVWGLLFPLAYGLASICAVIQRGHYYRDNVFEKQARRGESALITTKAIL